MSFAVAAVAALLLFGESAAAQIDPPATQGVTMGTAAVVGTFGAGPVDTPIFVSSYSDAQRVFGSTRTSSMQAIRTFFDQGGRRLYVVRLDVGATAVPSPSVLIGDASARTGMYALLDAERCATLVLPTWPQLGESASAEVFEAAASFAARRGAVLLLDAPARLANATDVARWRAGASWLEAPNAAMYYPPTQDANGFPIGVAGAVAGVLARIEIERGVWNAVSGSHARLLGVFATSDLSTVESDMLAAAGVNSIVRLRATEAPVLWGERTLSNDSDPTHRYLHLLRLRDFIHWSLREGTEWASAHTNDPALREALETQALTFLDRLYDQGAFAGSYVDESYGVTVSSVNVRTVAVDVRFAPLRPAELATTRILVGTAMPFIYRPRPRIPIPIPFRPFR